MIRRYKKDSKTSYTLGLAVTFELLCKRPETLTQVYVHSSTIQNNEYRRLAALCQAHMIPIEHNDKPFQILSQKDNCYVIGVFTKYENPLQQNQSHIVLVNPSNTGNLGTIMRSMLGFHMSNLAIIRPAVDLFEPKAIRASMGAVFSQHFAYFDYFEQYQALYPAHALYAFMLDGMRNIADIHPHAPFALVFGNEASGLPSQFSSIGTGVKIPHASAIDSLNLPIAVGIALYETTKSLF